MNIQTYLMKLAPTIENSKIMSDKQALQIRMDKHGNESPMAPLCEFDEKTGEFEYVDSVMRKKKRYTQGP